MSLYSVYNLLPGFYRVPMLQVCSDVWSVQLTQCMAWDPQVSLPFLQEGNFSGAPLGLRL